MDWVDLGVADFGAEVMLEEGCNEACRFSILNNISDWIREIADTLEACA